ncbi:MAG: thiamine pyrophosphate-binding protein [Rhodospirillaceae bacterium]|jgi:acetolactate synthase I/II/III large subunit|nr:thiamine pyrophosphate-binding protein [Rhodospirillaceae bacterium]MBT6116494.1 thiamine pyrophosphate-binding protein [Rhodospirillaceae bacterium]
MTSGVTDAVDSEVETADGPEMMTGAQALVRWLEAEGFEVAFGCCGHGNIGLLDALVDSRIRYVSCPHEQLAVHAADAYYRTTGRPALVTTTIGPGLGNTTNAVMDAMQDCSAVLVIAGDTIRRYEGTDSFQEVRDAGQAQIFEPIVKRAWRVRQPHALLNSMARAMNYMVTGEPGPVLVSVAMDLFSYVDAFDIEPHRRRWPTCRRLPGSEAAIGEAVKVLAEAHRPTIFAGGGILGADATEELVRLAERLDAPVVTSMIGQSGFPNTHRLYAGNSGSVGTPTGKEMLQGADVLLALGTRFGEIDCNSWLPDHFIRPSCQVVQVDINPVEIGKVFPVAAGIVGDLKVVLTQLLAATELGAREPSERTLGLVEARKSWRSEFVAAARNDAMPMELEAVIADVQEALPEGAIIGTGVGIRHHVGQFYQFDRPRTHIVASGHGTMGWATAAVIGAKIARPDCPVVALVGDGEMRSTSEAIGVATEAGVAPVWVVMNNAGYNIIGLYQKRLFGRTIGTEFGSEDNGKTYSPDYARLGEAYGALGFKVTRRSDLIPMLSEALASGQPAVIEVPVTQTPRLRAFGYWDANTYMKPGWNQAN